MLAELLEVLDRLITYVSAEVRVIGDMAFDRGSFSFTVSPQSGGETTQEDGKYLWLYSHAGDGSRKVARAIVSLDARDVEQRNRSDVTRRLHRPVVPDKVLQPDAARRVLIPDGGTCGSRQGRIAEIRRLPGTHPVHFVQVVDRLRPPRRFAKRVRRPVGGWQ